MKCVHVFASFPAALLGAAVIAQSPQTDVDRHLASARAAAGMDFRNSFINLCLPGGGRGPAGAASGRAANQSAAAGGAGGATGARGRGGPPDRANWYAPPFKVFD